MDSLVQDRIYRKVSVVDYQGVCPPQESHVSSAPKSIISGSIIKTIGTMFGIFWASLIRLNVYQALNINPVLSWPGGLPNGKIKNEINDF